MNPKVDFFFNKDSQWQSCYKKLRNILLDTGLTEELKWGCPCYTENKSNVVLIHGFKEYCALLFHKGALLKDAEGILIQQTENVQSARQMRFTDLQEIVNSEAVIKSYIYEAIEVEKAGLEVTYKKTAEFNIPEEFQKILDKKPDLKVAFEALTPGRQRGYLLHFSQPKQSKTRESRIEKCIPLIFEGKGWNEQ
ncbi:YdeI/OmpD-associated family protein [Fulvivirga sp.]|uniref:YdeI/OmpD-associated family protein n=1 Tax=Fulvivirga sp. TaxID=1931237 RepID=UPI0032ED7929